MGNRGHDPRVLAIDAGGTMTDTFIVVDAGNLIVGKTADCHKGLRLL